MTPEQCLRQLAMEIGYSSDDWAERLDQILTEVRRRGDAKRDFDAAQRALVGERAMRARVEHVIGMIRVLARQSRMKGDDVSIDRQTLQTIAAICDDLLDIPF